MSDFFLTKKSAPSSVDKASSGVSQRMSKNAGSNKATKTGKGHFAAAAQRIAKKRSGTTPPAHLQYGVPKHAPVGALKAGGGSSNIVNREGDKGVPVKATEAQTALNPMQRGKSNRMMQIDGRVGANE